MDWRSQEGRLLLRLAYPIGVPYAMSGHYGLDPLDFGDADWLSFLLDFAVASGFHPPAFMKPGRDIVCTVTRSAADRHGITEWVLHVVMPSIDGNRKGRCVTLFEYVWRAPHTMSDVEAVIRALVWLRRDEVITWSEPVRAVTESDAIQVMSQNIMQVTPRHADARGAFVFLLFLLAAFVCIWCLY